MGIPPATILQEHLQHVFRLEADANEVLLLHGTKDKNIHQIINQGFDERCAERTLLYGGGNYFTVDLCKATQYCDDNCGCLLISRVILGHAFEAQGPMTDRRPPTAHGYGVPHDSVVARPGIPNGYYGGQIHWEA